MTDSLTKPFFRTAKYARIGRRLPAPSTKKGGIWEPFYNEHEERAKEGDGILLNKYYNEGACATIAAAWITGDKQCKLWHD